MKNIWKRIKSTYYRAYKEISRELNKLETKYPDITVRTFAGCVCMLCHDDIALPIAYRSNYLFQLADITGGPTLREHYCLWKAFGRGDAVRTVDNPLELTQFQLDERFTRPGEWTYAEAYKFAKEHVFAPIGKEHYFISQIEQCIDDPQIDLTELAKFNEY